VWDRGNDFLTKCNLDMVLLEEVVEDDDIAELLEMVHLHHENTGSTVAKHVLDRWPEVLKQFKKVMPTDYKRVLMLQKQQSGDESATLHEEVHSR
jgi:glutamate synthase domain-containing protein 3